jgi:hypothetical protein
VTTKANVLELNGRPYDALTGLLMDGPHHKVRQAVDGFFSTPQHNSATPAQVKPKPESYKTEIHHPALLSKSRAFDIKRNITKPAAHHQPQHATTLMRRAVHQPTVPLKRHLKVAARTDLLSKIPRFDIVPKYSATTIDEARLKRAVRIAKNKLISRFGNIELTTTPAIKAVTPVAQLQAKVAPVVDNTPPVTHQPSDDIFERALAHATSHTQPLHKHKRASHHKNVTRRFSSLAAASLAVLLIIGFVSYQNAANIQIRVASSRAGINATLPKWEPSGFAIGKFTYSPGTVAVNFHSNNGQHSFSLVQTASKWNSATLFDQYVFPNSNSYEAIKASNTTIYAYNNTNATWVNNGIWFKLIGNGSLSTSQLVTLAASM